MTTADPVGVNPWPRDAQSCADVILRLAKGRTPLRLLRGCGAINRNAVHSATDAFGQGPLSSAKPTCAVKRRTSGRELSFADYLPTVGAKPSAPPFQALAQIAIRSTSSSVISSPVRS